MTIFEYGEQNEKKLLFIATAALEPYWAFQKQAEKLGDAYHVYAAAASGHDGKPGDFTSIEETAADIAAELKRRGVTELYAAYGLSMGGAIVVRFLVTGGIPVGKAVIDGGILPYSYPKWMCKAILVKDFLCMRSITRSRRLLELVAPPEQFTAEGSDPKEEYDGLMEFYKTYSDETILNEFWSANNYELPQPAPALETEIVYWCAEKERFARRGDMRTIAAYLPQTKFREIKGVGHGELVMIHLTRFDETIRRELEGAEGDRVDIVDEKADYANWYPKEMIAASAAGAGVLLAADAALRLKTGKDRSAGAKALSGALKLGAAGAGALTIYGITLHRAFSYDGKRQLSRQIIEGIAEEVTIPAGGMALDVGCGSGALTIACAKRNPKSHVTGVDLWGPEYRAFTKERCERNAAAEGVTNVSFQRGDANKLEFPDETFDAVVSNYVYHNIMGKDRQALLLETLRTLKKGGTFAIHDLMSPVRFGDMEAFAERLRAMGYEEVRLIDTTDGRFMNKTEATLMGLGSSTLLVGRK